jgi:hypothetical protein
VRTALRRGGLRQHPQRDVEGDRPALVLPEQGWSLTGQLDGGVRALLVDVWPGYPTAGGRVATALTAYDEAKAELVRDFGAETVDAALPVIDSVGNRTPAAPEALYLCHGLCELGWADLDGWLIQLTT